MKYCSFYGAKLDPDRVKLVVDDRIKQNKGKRTARKDKNEKYKEKEKEKEK